VVLTLRTTRSLIFASRSQAAAKREAASSHSRKRTARDDDDNTSPMPKRVRSKNVDVAVNAGDASDDPPSSPIFGFEDASSSSTA
jgi:hypothetical protein